MPANTHALILNSPTPDLTKLVDTPNTPDLSELIRLWVQKWQLVVARTVVMAMLIAWGILATVPKCLPMIVFPYCCSGGLSELDNQRSTSSFWSPRVRNYYDEFLHSFRQNSDRCSIGEKYWLPTGINSHRKSPHKEGDKTYNVVNKRRGRRQDIFAKRVLGELYDRAPIMVLNDEGHHALSSSRYKWGDSRLKRKNTVKQPPFGFKVWTRWNKACGN